MKYKVEHLKNNIYQVLEMGIPHNTLTTISPSFLNAVWELVFQGTLQECDTWINLHEKGYM